MPEHINKLVRKLESIALLSDRAKAALAALPMRVKELDRGEEVATDGERPPESCLLISGYLHRFKITPAGRRQIFAFHAPGDIPDLLSLHLTTMDHSIAAIAPSTVAFIPHESLRQLMRDDPELADVMWRDTLIDGSIFRAWLVAMGQQDADSHMAHLFCELFTRMRAVGLNDRLSCALPLRQTGLGDALGLSSVHVNRTLQELRRQGLVSFERFRLDILDWDGLAELGEFNPAYLHLRPRAPTMPRPA